MARAILLIEDDPPILEMERDLLTGAGYAVLTGLGEEALAIARRDRPDLILLDLQLPFLDGWAMREGLLRHPDTKDIPVIVLTARSRDAWHIENMQAHAVIQKPFGVMELLRTVKAAIGPPSAAKE